MAKKWDDEEHFLTETMADLPLSGIWQSSNSIFARRTLNRRNGNRYSRSRSGQDESFTVNKLVLQKQRMALENLAISSLLLRLLHLVIGILRILGGSGSPVSVAFCLMR